MTDANDSFSTIQVYEHYVKLRNGSIAVIWEFSTGEVTLQSVVPEPLTPVQQCD